MPRHEIDPTRCLVGLATCFGVPTRDGQKGWDAQHFDLVVGLEDPVPLRLNHGPSFHSWRLTDNIGTVQRYAAVTYPTDGLLILAEVGDAYGVGDSLLRDIARELSFEYFNPTWSFSLGALWDGEDQVIIREISLTRNPAFTDVRVLAAGAEAVELFSMLSEKRPAAA